VQVAVRPVRMVERAVHLVVVVIAVWDEDVARLCVRAGAGAFHRRAGAGAAAVDLEPVLVGVPFVRRMEVAVVQVVGVVAVPDGLVAAPVAVSVRVVSVLLAAHASILAIRPRSVNRGIIC
jgi:hypothetical protein